MRIFVVATILAMGGIGSVAAVAVNAKTGHAETGAAKALPWTPQTAEPNLAQSDYIEHCAGCHGIGGTSAPALVPVLKDRVGYFMCTAEGRDYMVRLPNVTHMRITDPQQIADMMNFMVFRLGGESTAPGTRLYTADEVANGRKNPLTSQSLKKVRADIVNQIVRKCGAPASLRLFYPGQKPGQRS